MLLDKSIFVYRGKSKFIYVEECVVFQGITSKFIIRWCYILLVSMHKCTFFVYKWLFLTLRSTLWIKHGSRGWECKTVVFFHYPYWALVSHGPEIFVVIPPTCFFFTVVMVKLKENVIIIYFEPKFIANDDLQMYSHIHT